MEEVGYESAKLTLIKALSLAPSYMGHVTHIVLAQDLSPRREAGDEPEELEVVKWNINDTDTLLARADFSEGRSVAALFLAKQLLQQGRS